MVLNNEKGYVFALDDWKCLERFLILGTEGGTYYASEKKLTLENTQLIQKLLASDGLRFISEILDASYKGKAHKNDYALYALALAIAFGDNTTKAHAGVSLPQVARTASHLTQFLAYVTEFRGWGRALKRAVANWYEQKPIKDLSYQMTKYSNRNGWTQFDVLNAAHPKDESKNELFRYFTKGNVPENIEYIQIVEKAKTASALDLSNLILEYRLPQELIPNEHRNDPIVWQALLNAGMPMTAIIRNIAAMTSYGALDSAHTDIICNKLTDKEAINGARIHPLSVIAAMLTYKSGHGNKGNLTWKPIGRIIDALDESFYLAFDAIEPSNKRISIGLDVSGSMNGGECGGITGLTPRIASAVLCMATIRVEKRYSVHGFSDTFIDLSEHIGKRTALDSVIRNISNLPFAGTDCSLPIETARKSKEEYDAFIIYTDNETYAGRIHPFQSLNLYRKETGINAKLIVVGMTSTGFTIADPSDAGMLDVVGLSTGTPAAISSFISE